MPEATTPLNGVSAVSALRQATRMVDLMTQTLQQFNAPPQQASSNPLQQLAGLLGQALSSAATQAGGQNGTQEAGAGQAAGGADGAAASGQQGPSLQQTLLQTLGTLLSTLAKMLEPAQEAAPEQATPAAQDMGEQLGAPPSGAAPGGAESAAAAPAAATPASPAPGAAPASPAAPTGASPAAAPAASPAAAAPTATTPSATSFNIPDVGVGGDLSPKEIASTYGNEIKAASDKSGVDPAVLAGMIWQESKGRPETPNGGLTQIGSHEFAKYGGTDISNPGQNIMAAAMYMKDLEAQFGSTGAALRGYNSGPYSGVDPSNLSATPAGTGDPTYVDKVLQAAEKSGL